MRGRNSPGDGEIAALAGRQHGLIARRQLIALGLGEDAIDYRLARRRLHGVYPGVYALGHPTVTGTGRLMAAVLACGPGALLSHRDAASEWGIRRTARTRIDITTAARSRTGLRGIDLHRVRMLHPADRAVVDGIPVTSLSRTLLDLAEVISQRELARAFEEAERLRILDVKALEELCARSPGRRGLRGLRAVLAEARTPEPATRSELERRFLALCRDGGLPPPAVNLFVAGYEVDMVWPDQRLVVELDGHAFHRTRAGFERDRERDAALQLAGYRVLRLTQRRLETEPAAVVDMVSGLLRAGSPAPPRCAGGAVSPPPR